MEIKSMLGSGPAIEECVDFYGIVGGTIRQIALQSAASD